MSSILLLEFTANIITVLDNSVEVTGRRRVQVRTHGYHIRTHTMNARSHDERPQRKEHILVR